VSIRAPVPWFHFRKFVRVISTLVRPYPHGQPNIVHTHDDMACAVFDGPLLTGGTCSSVVECYGKREALGFPRSVVGLIDGITQGGRLEDMYVGMFLNDHIILDHMFFSF
jgi:hypothetical protein